MRYRKKNIRGNIVAKINKWEVTVLKWRDRWDVLIVSVKHTNKSIIQIVWTSIIIKKAEVVVDYNAGKGLIDLSDELGS